jgi:hypothetical protein
MTDDTQDVVAPKKRRSPDYRQGKGAKLLDKLCNSRGDNFACSMDSPIQ